MRRQLIEGARNGDERAFSALADDCVDRLLKVAHGILRDRQMAEDATQEALLDIWRRLPTLRDTSRFDAWSYRLVVNACHSELRRSRGWLTSVVGAVTREPAHPDHTSLVHDMYELEHAFETLSLDHRAVVILHHYIGLSMADTAEALGIREGTARSRLYYGMKRLRASLTPAPEDTPFQPATRESPR